MWPVFLARQALRAGLPGFRRPVRLLTIAALSTSLVACFGGRGAPDCAEPEEYQASRSIEPIVVPDDLQRPEDAGQFLIPPRAEAMPEPTAAERARGGCLQRPPDFFGRTETPPAR